MVAKARVKVYCGEVDYIESFHLRYENAKNLYNELKEAIKKGEKTHESTWREVDVFLILDKVRLIRFEK